MMDNPRNGEEMCELAYEYIKGLNGKDVDEHKGAQWLIKSAENGYADAMRNLGTFYFGNKQGQPIYGLPVNHQKGVRWLKEAIDKGDDLVKGGAMTNLAICYIKGEGVPVDINKAFELCKKASELGDSDAKHLLNNYFSQ
jgi:TPR repeat protein